MKKTLNNLFPASLLILILFSAEIALAATTTTISDPAQSITNSVNEFVCTLLNFITLAATGIATLMIMLAGIRYMTSQDDPEVRNSAKNTVIYTVIGLIIVLMVCPLIDYLVANTDITPFQNSCTCLVSSGNEPNPTTTTTISSGTTTPKNPTTTKSTTTTTAEKCSQGTLTKCTRLQEINCGGGQVEDERKQCCDECSICCDS